MGVSNGRRHREQFKRKGGDTSGPQTEKICPNETIQDFNLEFPLWLSGKEPN